MEQQRQYETIVRWGQRSLCFLLLSYLVFYLLLLLLGIGGGPVVVNAQAPSSTDASKAQWGTTWPLSCPDMTTAMWNPVVCSLDRSDTKLLPCQKTSVDFSLCTSAHGVCVGDPPEESKCGLCGGVPVPISGTFNSLCQQTNPSTPTIEDDLNELLVKSLGVYFVRHLSPAHPPYPIRVDTTRVNIRANRINSGTMTKGPYATMLVDYYDKSPRSAHSVVDGLDSMTVSLHPHRYVGDLPDTVLYNFPLDPFFLQRRATPSNAEDLLRFPTLQTSFLVYAIDWRRANASSYLILANVSSTALRNPSELQLLGTQADPFPAVSQVLRLMPLDDGSQITDDDFNITAAISNGIASVNDKFDMLVNASTYYGKQQLNLRETVHVLSVSGTTALAPFLSLHRSFNILSCGQNPFLSTFYVSKWLNHYTPMLPFLMPVKIKKTLSEAEDPATILLQKLRNSGGAVYPVSITFFANITQLIRLSNGDLHALPVYRDQRIHPPDAAGVTAASSVEALLSFNDTATVLFPSAYEEELFRNVSEKIAQGFTSVASYFSAPQEFNRKSALYQAGGPSMLVQWFGTNTYGQFGLGSDSDVIDAFFDGGQGSERELLLPDRLDGEYIQKISIGNRHTLVLTTKGRLFFAGNPEETHTNCVPGTASHSSFFRIDEVLLDPDAPAARVIDITAGHDFTVAVHGEPNGPKTVTVCGGAGYLIPSDTTIPTVRDDIPKSISLSKVCGGTFYACVGDRLTNPNSNHFPLWDVYCFGRQDTIHGTADRPSDDPTINRAMCGNHITMYHANSVEAFSCGSHHAGFLMRSRYNPNELQNDLYPDFLAAYQCGSNYYGQLGAHLQPLSAPQSGIYPLSPVSEGVYSTRPPSVYLYQNNGDSDSNRNLEPTQNFQLFETAGISLFENSTFLFIKMKEFDTPEMLMRNASRSGLGQYPVDGPYSIFNIFADVVRRIPRNPTSEIVASEQYVYEVSFTTVKGLAAFLVSMQTKPDQWTTYTGSPDGTLPPANDVVPDLKNADSFFRNWRVLWRNVTTVSGNTTTMTIVFPSLFVKLSSGRVYAVDHLSTACTPTGTESTALLYCDESTKKVVWGHALAQIPNGYSSIIDGTNVTWVALYATFAAQNISKTFNASVPGSMSFTPGEVESALDFARDGALRTEYARSIFFCFPSISIFDCSSVVFFETFRAIDSTSDAGEHFSHVLNKQSFENVEKMTQTTTGGMCFDGVAAHTLGRRRQDQVTDVPTVLPWDEGLVSLELYPMQYETLSIGIGFSKVCIFVQLAENIYFVTLQSEHIISVCSAFGYFGDPPAFPYITWYVDGAYLIISQGTTVLAFKLSCNGGVADNTHYTIFSNSSLVRRLMLQRLRLLEESSKPAVLWWDSSSWPDGTPGGCDGGFLLPTSPVVATFDAFQLMLYSSKTIVDEFFFEFAYDRLSSSNVSGLRQLRFSVGFGGISVFLKTQLSSAALNEEVVNEALNTAVEYDLTKPSLIPLSSQVPPFGFEWNETTRNGTLISSGIENGFICVTTYVPHKIWNRILLRYLEAENVTQMFVGDTLVCSGHLLDLDIHFKSVSGVFLGARNPTTRLQNYFNIREVTFCDSSPVTNPGAGGLFPCMVAGRVYAEVVPSTTTSISQSTSGSVSGSFSASGSSSQSETFSTSETFSISKSESMSKSLSQSTSQSQSFSPTSSLELTATVTHKLTVTRSKSVQKHISLSLGDLESTVLTVDNIRRSGITLTLHLRDDVFFPYHDWRVDVLRYIDINCSTPSSDNPAGLTASLGRAGFITGRVNSENNSQLLLQLGPDRLYNSYHDEMVTLRLRPRAVASTFYVPDVISFVISGRGFLPDDMLGTVELLSGSTAMLAGVLGGFPSGVLYAAGLSLQANFHCFNTEDRGLSRLFSLFRVEWGTGKTARLLGAYFSMGVFLASIITVHVVIVLVVWMKKTSSRLLVKSQAVVLFPSLTVLLCLLWVPAWTYTAVRYAMTDGSGGAFGIISVVPIVVGGCVIYLIGELYDDASFGAKFLQESRASLKELLSTHGFWMIFSLPGRWISIDRNLSFYPRFRYLITWCTPQKRFFMLVEISEILLTAITTSITNNHPAMCIAQALLLMLYTLAMFAAILLMRPYLVRFFYWVALVVFGARFGLNLLKLIDLIRGESPSVGSALDTLFIALFLVLFVFSFFNLIVTVRSSFLKLKFQQIVTNAGKYTPRAPPKTEQEQQQEMLEAKLLREAHGDQVAALQNLEQQMKEFQQKQEAALHRDDGKPKPTPNKLLARNRRMSFSAKVKHMDCKIDIPEGYTENPSMTADPDSEAAESVLLPMESIGGSALEEGGTEAPTVESPKSNVSGRTRRSSLIISRKDSFFKSRQKPELLTPPKRKETNVDASRDFYRLIALEEATDRPGQPVPYNALEDDDLL